MVLWNQNTIMQVLEKHDFFLILWFKIKFIFFLLKKQSPHLYFDI
jgi:hypothetical protein